MATLPCRAARSSLFPAAAASSLAKHSHALAHALGTAPARRHPALRAMAGQISSLFNVDSLGPPADVLDEVGANAVRLGLMEAEAQRCAYCGDEVKADRMGHLWATDPNDGQPLWCDPAPDKRHALEVKAA